MWLQFPQESNEKEIMNKFKSNDYVCNFDLTKCDYNFYMKIILKRWWNSKQNPLYLYSYFCTRNKCSLLKSDDWLCNFDLTKRWKCDYNFHIKIKQTNCDQNKFILSSYGASSNYQDYI